jgi:acyl-CoA thioesterase-1
MRRKSQEHRSLLALLFLCSLGLFGLPVSAQQQSPTLLVFGDSLSAGYRMPIENGWVSLLDDKIKMLGIDYKVVNASVSGETTDGGLSRLPATLATHKPAIVILELGGNDGLRGIPVANIKRNLITMVQMSQEVGAKVILAGMQIPPNYGPRYTDPFTAQFEEIAQDLGLPLIPFLIDGIAQQAELMQDDGIHPKAEAQGMVLDNVWPILETVLSAGAPQS